jgi:N utilization substance protein B
VGARRDAREFALQILYAHEINPVSTEVALRLFWDEHTAPKAVRDFATQLVMGVVQHRADLDRLIEEKSKNWSVGRMAKVDLNVLRMAAYELLHCEDVPKNVAINEAIEVARTFGTEDSPAFINGIIDEIAAGIPEKPAA